MRVVTDLVGWVALAFRSRQSLDAEVLFLRRQPAALAKNLANFDDLDFHVYTGQQWENLYESNAQDIVVHYPDGHTTKGIPDHIRS